MNDDTHVEILKFHPQVIHICLSINQSPSHFFYSIVYASPHATVHKELWPFLCSLADSTTDPWILVGDFNCILEGSEHSRGAQISHPSCKWFQQFLIDMGLRNVKALGARFTWYRGNLSQKLDRALYNVLGFLCS